MPVYHFTFHAYGTWLPDHPQGYILRNKGWQPPSDASAGLYRSQMQQHPAAFSPITQQHIIRALIECQTYQRHTLYAIATDSTHIHTVTAWTDERAPTSVRSQIKSKMTRSLNKRFIKKKWLAANAGQTPVQDTAHLYRLVHEYLPKHEMYWHYKQNECDAS